MKTNRNLIGINLYQILNQIKYRAHIISISDEFMIYELPLNNFKFETKADMIGYSKIGVISLSNIEIELESQDNKEVNIEIKYIEFGRSNEETAKRFKNYDLPIFIKTNKNI